jgi:RNA polymerase sigma-70 factor (ECF subfamily)
MEKDRIEVDGILIRQFLEGKEEAFGLLVRKHQDRVLNIVYSLIGNDRESDDILQEVFLKVYYNLKDFKDAAKFSTWLYRITVNTTYDFLRRRRHVVYQEDSKEEITIPKENLLGEIYDKEKKELIQAALDRLSFKYRLVVVLKDIEGLSYFQISKVIGRGIGTVESRLFRARQLLKRILINLKGEIR